MHNLAALARRHQKPAARLAAAAAAASLALALHNNNAPAKNDAATTPTSHKKLQRHASLALADDGTTQAWAPPPRDSVKKALKSREFDVLVIGGGATGTGTALDAAKRGLDVAMIERDDFASGTSSRSTKLIHGGIRYLAQAFQTQLPPNSIMDIFRHLRIPFPGTAGWEYLKILNADLYERKFMIDSATFMTKPLPIMVPMYRWWEVPFFFIAGKMYDFIAGRRRSVPPSHYISASEVLYQFPEIREENKEGCKLKGALVFNEGQQNDTRMNVHIALTASQEGATVANHTEVVDLLTEGTYGAPDYKVVGAEVRDAFTGETYKVRARQVIGACGVFSDKLRRMADPECREIMVAGPGSHLVMPDYCCPERMGFLWFTEDGRVLYLLPWEGSTLAGTTDAKGEVTYEPQCSMGDVDFIIGECNRVVKEPLDYSNVKSAWAGLRPLVRDPNADPDDTKKLSRDHVIDVVAGGFVSICGGKWTTYRQMAEDGINKALEINPRLRERKIEPCTTLESTLIGSDRTGQVSNGKFDKVTVMLREKYGVDKASAEHLVHNYGTRAIALAEMAAADKNLTTQASGATFYNRLSSKYPILEAEVIFAVRQEYACTAVDVLARRTRLSFLDAHAAVDCLPRVIEMMAKELGWSSKRKEQEKMEAMKFLETMYMPKKEDGVQDVVSEVIKRGANRKLVQRVTTLNAQMAK